jgi:hypothetical protein
MNQSMNSGQEERSSMEDTTPVSIHDHAGENPAEPLAPDQQLAS